MAQQPEHSLPGKQTADTVIDVTSLGTTESSDVDMVTTISNSTFASGMRITLENVTFSLPSNVEKGKKAYLLQSVNDVFEPGKMTALMGPSGSGKTTLLDILAGRKTTGTIEGSIRYGGVKATPAFLRRYTGYVEQFDTLIPSLTVYDMLMYTAELKRPRTEPHAAKHAAVESLIDSLGLRTCRDVLIGSHLSKGISGGQAKRVNIGIALIPADIRVLFLDEPTSGLDSFTANEVMTVVKNLATARGITVVATIHSPTAYAFGLFDHLSMLVRGRTVYRGSASGDAVMGYMTAHLPAVLKRGTAVANVAEALVDTVTEADRQGRAGEMADAYDNSDVRRSNDKLLLSYTSQKQELSEQQMAELAVKRSTVTPWWWGLRTIFKYRTVRNYQDPNWLIPRLADKVVIGLLVMTLYLSMGREELTTANINNTSALLFMWVVLPAFGAASYMPAIALERGLFVRERNDGLYRVFTYLTAKMIDELLVAAFVSLATAAFVFYGIGFHGNFGVFWLTYYITLCIGVSLAYFIAAIAPDMEAANAILPTFVTICLFFGGLLITFDSMPPWWKWFSYIDFVKYGWGTLMISEFQGNDPMWVGGQTLLQFYGFDGIDKFRFMGFEALFFIVFYLGALTTLGLRKYSSR